MWFFSRFENVTEDLLREVCKQKTKDEMAPEECDVKSCLGLDHGKRDVFALGLLIQEILTVKGMPLFDLHESRVIGPFF